ncbi:MAG: RluA family pseudouridine synthase [Lachnospiraceae bacterium]|nr:RluA family pseudouridine synthase [Lachnospiraceae bacterium]
MVSERIDRILSELLCDRSRSFLQKLIEDGNVTVDGRSIKASYKLRPADSQIEVLLPPLQELKVEQEDIPLDILYEDEDVLVINKPKDMVVHPAPGHMTNTVVGAALYHCKGELSGINGVLRPGIVHRIDKDTTGSLIICKNDNAHRSLAFQLEEHSLQRSYRALVWGTFDEAEGIVDKPLGRDRKDRKRMAISTLPEGKRAVTHYRMLESFDKVSYIECRLETGRTHQIRVHMAHLGHPVLFDELYGRYKLSSNDMADEKLRSKRVRTELAAAGLSDLSAEGIRGQCLHAMELGFAHPKDGHMVSVSAPLPEYFERLLRALRGAGEGGEND